MLQTNTFKVTRTHQKNAAESFQEAASLFVQSCIEKFTSARQRAFRSLLVQVETGHMSAPETGQMSAVETSQMSTIKTGQSPVSILYFCLVSTADICPVSPADICPVSTEAIYPISTEDIIAASLRRRHNSSRPEAGSCRVFCSDRIDVFC